MRRIMTVWVALLGVLFAVNGFAQDQRRLAAEFIELTPDETVVLDIRYATSNNFMHRPVYKSTRTYLHKDAFAKFEIAKKELRRQYPKLKFVVFDALRTRTAQKALWDVVKNTPERMYVASPANGSVHNYGFALDLSLVDEHGRELDMGTPYDSFQTLAQPRQEQTMFRAGKLSLAQLENRKILRKVMVAAGFRQLPHEWWHYNALPLSTLKKQYRIVE